MEFKGTKGDWKIKHWGSNGLLDEKEAYAIDSDCWAVCAVWKDIDDVEPLANAKLIAAAPELLKALQDLVDDVNDNTLDDKQVELVYNAKKAIEKALK